jgi:hypothetical protein
MTWRAISASPSVGVEDAMDFEKDLNTNEDDYNKLD